MHWEGSSKLVLARRRIQHALGIGSPYGVGEFFAPSPTMQLYVNRLRLHAAMARTALTSGASPELLRAQLSAAAASVDYCVDDATAGFVLSQDLLQLNQAERASLAGRIGAGLCDLYMESMRYVWRDQASILIPTREPLADFVYEGGAVAGLGVALAEAKGSMQRKGPKAGQRRVNAAYLRQVERHVGRSTPAGKVLHGYAVGLTAAMGLDAYLCIAETQASGPPIVSGATLEGDGSVDIPFGRVSLSTALGNYATNLQLCGYRELGVRLRALQTGGDSPTSVASVMMSALDGQRDGLVGGAALGADSVSDIGFSLRVEPLLELTKHVFQMPKNGAGDAIIELPILAIPRRNAHHLYQNQEDDSVAQFADGLFVFRRTEEQAAAFSFRPPSLSFSVEEVRPPVLRSRRRIADLASAAMTLETRYRPLLEQEPDQEPEEERKMYRSES